MPGSYEDAADAPVVLPAMFLRDGMLNTLEPLRSRFDDKLWIDITNPFNDKYDDFIFPWNTSSAEEIQKCFPRARVVGAFKNVWWEVFDQPAFEGGVSDVYVVGDDDASKREFQALVDGSPFRFLDAGRLYNARFVERMTLFAAELGQRQGYFPRMNWRLLGEPWSVGKADRVKHLIVRN
jgi:8-hydroxy-5-deazaflavin:NADPH oxidoreductase